MPVAPQQIPVEQDSPDWSAFYRVLQNIQDSPLGGSGNLHEGLNAFLAMLAGTDPDAFVLEGHTMGIPPELGSLDRQIAMTGQALKQYITSRREKKQAQQETKGIGDQPFHTEPPPSTQPSVIPRARPGQRPYPQTPQMQQRSRMQDQPQMEWSVPTQDLLRRWY